MELETYDKLIDKCSEFERKGKSMPHTSANGYMFSALNKKGELGIRFSKEKQQKYINDFQTSIFKSYGAEMKGYVLIPERMFTDLDNLSVYLKESYDYAMSLKSK